MCGVCVNSEHVFRHSSFPRFSHLRAPPHSLAFLVFLHMCIWSKNATDENAEYRESSVSEFPCAPVPSRSIRARSRIPPRSRAHALPRAPWPPFPRALPLPVAHVLPYRVSAHDHARIRATGTVRPCASLRPVRTVRAPASPFRRSRALPRVLTSPRVPSLPRAPPLLASLPLPLIPHPSHTITLHLNSDIPRHMAVPFGTPGDARTLSQRSRFRRSDALSLQIPTSGTTALTCGFNILLYRFRARESGALPLT